jgi:hypothetical protein
MSDVRLGPKESKGPRGPRGERGPRGPTGPAGPSSGARIGRQVFDVATSTMYIPTSGTTKAVVRGSGAGGGGGGMDTTAVGAVGASSGGNTGIAAEVEISAPPGTLLTGGPLVVGAGGPGGSGSSAGTDGGTSTLLIGGILLTLPGGFGGNSGAHGATPPVTVDSNTPTPSPNSVDYQAADLGQPGNANGLGATSIRGGDGGSGDYGIGGKGAFGAGDGFAADGNGAGGGGAAQTQASAVVRTGGDGTDGLWIIEEYS